MRKRTVWMMAWLASVLVLLGLMVGGTAVSHADKKAEDHFIYLPLLLNPETDPAWLTYLNHFRQLANLPDLTERSDWSAGGVLHSRYMVKNDEITHSEDSNNQWYTADGAAAGQNGNVAVFSLLDASDEMAIDLWMTGPFHAVGIIDPELHQTGFGSYHEDVGTWRTGATLDVLRGLGAVPGNISYPILFPQDGSDYWLTSYGGNEWPDPLTSCPGYSAPTGPPIMVQLGSGAWTSNDVTPNVTSSSFEGNGVPLAHCVFDETNYVNNDSNAQTTGRNVLNSRDAVVIMPQYPLTVGETYTVSITHDGTTISWSFEITGSSPAALQSVPSSPFDYRIR